MAEAGGRELGFDQMEENVARVLLLHPKDNVAVALDDIATKSVVAVLGAETPLRLTAQQGIQFAHKLAMRPIAAGEAILKYGIPVGFATAPVAAGEWVHTHNVGSYYAEKKEAK